MLKAGSVGPVTARRAARAVSGHAIVVARVGAKGIRGAHGDRGRFIAGTMNHAVDLLSGDILAVIPGGSGNDDARVDQATDRAANWIVFVRVNRGRPQTHVEHPDVVGRAISHHPIQRGECAGDRAGALRVQHAQIDQVCVRRDA